jgi:WD40 repeat protein
VTSLLELTAPPSPYKGLAPFDDSELDAFLFFGRARETEVVTANVLASRLTVLYGPSGVGKSSLLRAGVVRSLRAEPGFPRPAVIYYGSWAGDAVGGLEDAAFSSIAETLGHEPTDSPGGLVDRLAAWSAELGAEICLLLDQLEELFLYHADESRGGFLDLLPQLVTRPGLRVNVLLGVRDDALSQLDVFKARIPNLFANSLRLDHLDREAGRAAILGPLECYAALGQPEAAVEIEDELVESVLDEVAAGRIDPGVSGRGGREHAGEAGRIETPYLQLVLQRIWEVERERGSKVLRLQTFRELGGAQRIVEDHLDRALLALTPSEKDAAANVFGHLVTPSGTKIAHGVADLASYAAVGERDLEPVLRALAGQRILRPLGENGHAGGRYEIFHDVLADAVLAWRTRHEAETALAREREAARKRLRRLAWVVAAALVALAGMSALAAYAFSQRGEAREQASLAGSERAEAQRQAGLARTNASNAREAQQDAQRQARRAKVAAARASQQALVARQARARADREKAEAVRAREAAAAAAQRAEAGEATAEDARGEAVLQAQRARDAEQEARSSARNARVQEQRARQQAAQARAARRNARADELVARSLAALAVDPRRSAQLAVAASRLVPSRETEDALRAALVGMRVEHILPGTGTGPDPFARFSGNGNRIVVGGGTSRIRVYRSSNAAVLRALAAGTAVNDAALSNDGRLVAAAGADGRVRVWDVDSGALRVVLDHQGAARGLAWAPQDDVLATVGAGSSPTARLWSTTAWAPLHRLGHPRALKRVIFSRDGRRIVTFGEGRVARVFDVRTGALVATLEHALGEITSAAFSPGSELVVTGGRDRVARVWNAATGDLRFTLGGHEGQVLDVAFSPNGERVATASSESLSRIFSARTGALEDVLRGHSGPPVNSIDFSPRDNNALVTASADETARYWGPAQLPIPLLGHRKGVVDATFSPDGDHVLTASRDGTARLWDPYGEPRVAVLTRHSSAIASVAVDPEGQRVASGAADGRMQVASLAGDVHRTLALGSPVVGVAWARRGLLLAATRDGVLRVWSRGGEQLLATMRHGGTIRGAAVSANGEIVASAGLDRAVRLWRVPTGAKLGAIDHPAIVTSVALDRTGRLVASASGSTAYVWRSRTRALVHELRGHANAVTAVAFNANGRLLATSSADRDAVIWDVAKGKGRKRLVGHGGTVAGVAFSPDGRWLATAGPIKAGVWQVGESDLPRSFLFFLTGYERPLSSVAFAQRNWTIVTGSVDGTVRSYRCVYCGGLRQLVPFARVRLQRLAKEEKR